MADRIILHCDLNCFFASVELLEKPALQNVPVAVCGDPASRHGIILAKNEPAKKMGIPQENIIFISDYDELKHYDTARLEYSTEYSDIIYGPTPHKTTGMGDTSSLLAKIKNEPTRYPRLTVATANGALKLSISSFKDRLTKTRYFEAQI